MKTPKPRKLESGNYFIQLRLNGKSIPITCDSPTECTLIAQKIKADYLAGATAIKKLPKNMTLREVEKKYINEFKEELSPSTADRYLAYTKCRFKKYLDMPLEEISWQQMIDDETKVASPKSVYKFESRRPYQGLARRREVSQYEASLPLFIGFSAQLERSFCD